MLRAPSQSNRVWNVVVAALQIFNVAIIAYVFIVLTSASLSWLVAFRLVKEEGTLAAVIGDVVYYTTDVFLFPVRKLLPNTSGMDISPVILGTVLLVMSRCLREIIASLSWVS
jgi:YggT family protein